METKRHFKCNKKCLPFLPTKKNITKRPLCNRCLYIFPDQSAGTAQNSLFVCITFVSPICRSINNVLSFAYANLKYALYETVQYTFANIFLCMQRSKMRNVAKTYNSCARATRVTRVQISSNLHRETWSHSKLERTTPHQFPTISTCYSYYRIVSPIHSVL